MANLNKVILIGRIVADPDPSKDVFKFQSGGKVTRLRFVVNNRKPDPQNQGQWIDDPVWLDLKFFNRGDYGKLADRAEALRKPQQICLEGHLQMEEWDDKTSGQKRQKIVIIVDSFQVLDRRDGDGGGNYGGDGASMGGSRPRNTNTSRTPAATGGGRNGNGGGGYSGGGGGGDESFDSSSENGDDIPF